MKRLLFLLLLCFVIIPTGIESQASGLPLGSISQPGTKTFPAGFQITNPKELASINTSGTALVSGTAQGRDNINVKTIKIHVVHEKQARKIIQNLMEEYNLSPDSLGIFAKEVGLSKGENLLQITLNRDGKYYIYNYVITYTDNVSGALSNKIKNTNTKDII